MARARSQRQVRATHAVRTRSQQRAARLSIGELPSELIFCTLHHLDAAELREAAAVCAAWRECVDAVAAERLRHLRPHYGDECPCWLRSLAALEMLLRLVGPAPTDRTWRAEYRKLHLTAAQLDHEKWRHLDAAAPAWSPEWTDGFEDDGPEGLHQFLAIDDWQPAIKYGWSEEDARMLSHLGGEEEGQVLTNSLLRGEADYAATLHASLRAHVDAARRDASAGRVVGPRYITLTGFLGVASTEPAWRLLPGLAIGEQMLVAGQTSFREPLACFFPEDGGARGHCQGMCREKLQANDEEWTDTWYAYELQHSDILEVVSAPPDRSGYHALVHDFFEDEEDVERGDQHGWTMPVLSSVTLLRVREPGEWSVRGLSVQRRCYTVSFSFGG